MTRAPKPRLVLVVLVFLSSALVPAIAAAQQTPDRQVWVQAVALGRLSDNWRTHVEIQPRVFDDASELGLTIARVAIGRRLAPRATLYAGYAWVPRTFGEGVRHEQRAWQQLSLVGPALTGWATSARIRLEQRTLDPWEDLSHRLRVLARAQRGAAAPGRWGGYGYNEIMFTLDDTGRGPERGFDRNRVSAGVTRRFAPALSVDAGYLWEHGVFGTDRRDDHVAIVTANITWP